jgi:hypothetical protein
MVLRSLLPGLPVVPPFLSPASKATHFIQLELNAADPRMANAMLEDFDFDFCFWGRAGSERQAGIASMILLVGQNCCWEESLYQLDRAWKLQRVGETGLVYVLVSWKITSYCE